MFGFLRKKKETVPEPVCKPVPAEERRVYMLDFDRTITILHTGSVAYGKDLTPEHIHRNVKKGFAEFVHRAVNSGHAVYIASYNDDASADVVDAEALSGHDLIKYYMDLVFGEEQNIFRPVHKNGVGGNDSFGNIIASNTQDYKQYHFDIIVAQEGLDMENPEDMKRVYLLDDDEDVVRFFMEKGCTVIVPFSASRSADTAAMKTLFTSYMPESFIA
ncbi:MAG: hypothetical protein R3297_06060 [Desulfobulbales bacterium]|nr:hypothetical protein [Desulfobulbales bacterium]